jgi:hypothetical protein
VLRCLGIILTVVAGMLPYSVSAQSQDFDISVKPTSAGPGDAVKVYFHSLRPTEQHISYCGANFEGNPFRDCSTIDGEWGYVTLHVPYDAHPGTMHITAGLRYEMPGGGVGDANANLALQIPAPVDPPLHTPSLKDFEISAKPTSARPGEAVTVSFHSISPEAQWIYSCKAHFEGNTSKKCDSDDDEWRYVTLYVPKNADSGTMLIRANLRYETENRVRGGVDANLAVDIYPLEPPRNSSGRRSGSGGNSSGRRSGTGGALPQAGGGPSTTVVPPAVVGLLPSVFAILALAAIPLIAIIALARGYHRRNSRSREHVQAIARSVPHPIPRIEESSKRPAWTICLNPRRGESREEIEEVKR